MNDPFFFSLARTPAERDEVFRLRYDCYRRAGAIPPNPERRFRDDLDDLPNQFSFFSGSSAEAAATVRISVVRPDLDWTVSPAGRIYANHPRFRAVADTSFVEASRLCFGPRAGRDAFLRLTAHMAALGEFYGVHWMLACPRVEHTGVYQRLFGFRPLAEARRYFGVAFQTRLLGVRTAELCAFVSSNRRMTAAWSEALDRLLESIPAQCLHEGMAISASSGK